MGGVVVHIPHSSVMVPPEVRSDILISDSELDVELLRMTDTFTDEIFGSAVTGAETVVFPVSRLVLDPERFEHDEEEPMAARGMGVIYEKTSDSRTLRERPSRVGREALLNRFYRPHHERLTVCVDAAIDRHGRCLVIDGHSFPSVPLPYELDQDPDRPDICIGTDSFHTPPELRDLAVERCQDLGWSVAVDRPFSGTIVPLTHYGRDIRVWSIMIEVNRRLYMNEETGTRLPGMGAVCTSVRDLLQHLSAPVAGLD